MASIVETQPPSASGAATEIIHKNLSQATLRPNPPPSPPTTETDTETDSNASNAPPPPESSTDISSPDSRAEEDAPVISPVTSPPYWINTHSHHASNARGLSSASVESLPTGGITLRDNESSSLDDRGNACWARSVEITDYVVVNGSTTNIGAFVVWNIRVETLSGSYMNIRKRYSEFDDFRWRLVRTFPNFEAAVPELPPKSMISKFRPRFLERRRAGLQYFLNCILLNPEFSGSPVLKEFLFS
ncbi:PX domain-containing protein YPT35 [Daldinia childiae]|uniref:PX domain-containing protein YPT35 n=1 Tax=Daldinia childiae TaxID=326645 RepID=UPI00144839E5|nr:PX domain-containing protein YPT35 [Daldinia childiae]KAF3057180.1 PX domain-containing protein YPT35 [Daldinia childiae]